MNQADFDFFTVVKVWAENCQGILDYDPDLTDKQLHHLLIERDLALTIGYDLLIDLTLNHISNERS